MARPKKKLEELRPTQMGNTVIRGKVAITLAGKKDPALEKRKTEFKEQAANLADQPLLLNRAKVLYVSGASIRDIAIALEIPQALVERTAIDNKWKELREKAQRDSEAIILSKIRAQAPIIMERQLETSSIIIDKIRKLLDKGDISPSELEALARSHKTTADVDSRVIGLDRKSPANQINVLISSNGGPIGDAPQGVTIDVQNVEQATPEQPE
jgi:hypothetical protein